MVNRVHKLKIRAREGRLLPPTYHPDNLPSRKKHHWFRLTETFYSNGTNGKFFDKTADPRSIFSKVRRYGFIDWTSRVKNLPRTNPIKLVYENKKGKYDDTLESGFRFVRNALEHGNERIMKFNDMERPSDRQPHVPYYDLVSEIYNLFPKMFDILFEMYDLPEEIGDLTDSLKVKKVSFVPEA